MNKFIEKTFLLVIIIIGFMLGSLMYKGVCYLVKLNKMNKEALSSVRTWCEKLASVTTENGTFSRYEDTRLPFSDPWGNFLYVSYSAGGFTETVKVYSSGNDLLPNTSDDIIAERTLVNFKGIGNGIKNNTGKLIGNSAKGLINGVSEGISDTYKKITGSEDKKEEITKKKE